jgi:hypothetical protein
MWRLRRDSARTEGSGMRSDRGQGTVEYLAVVLLVAVVLGGGATAAAATGAGAEIAAAVPREVIRALCIVRGGDCYRDRAPCDVASSSKSSSWAVTVAVIKFGHDKTVTVTKRSDGTFAVTLDTAPIGGVETSTGARAKVSLGKRSFSAGADITAGGTVSYVHGRTWIVRSEAAAAQLAAEIRDDAPLPPADVHGHDLNVKSSAGASAGGVANVSAGLRAALGGGVRTDRKSGNKTYFFTAGMAGNAGATVEGTDAQAAVSGSGGGQFALTVGPDGRWLDLAMVSTGELAARADLPSQVAPIAGALDVPTRGDRRWVVEAHLDLTEAGNLAAARTLVTRLEDPLHPQRIPGAVAALSRRIDDNAVVDARTYAVDVETRGAEGHVGVELKLGGKFEKSTENTRLVAATTRGIDGLWQVRNECLQEART